MRTTIPLRDRNAGPPTAWVLGGGGARGAAQVGVITALFETGVCRPASIYGTSVGALDGAVVAAQPNRQGAQLLRRLWLSEPAREVFRVHAFAAMVAPLVRRRALLSSAPLRKLIDDFQVASGCTRFEDLGVALNVVATDLMAGCPVVFRSGQLAPPLLASTAIPGVFPPVGVGQRICSDGGIVDNVPLSIAVQDGHPRILAIGLMAGIKLEQSISSLSELLARSLQLSLHHRLLSDFDRLKKSARIVVICPVTRTEAAWDMRPASVRSLIERSRTATRRLLATYGRTLFAHSGIHHLDLTQDDPP